MKEQNISPVAITERIQLLDVFRGLAIFGILMVNMQIFYHPLSYMLLGSQSGGEPFLVASESFIKFFFEGKFYVLFSMLFGYGFWLFINKPVSIGVNIIPVYLRRVFVLLLIGLIHITLIWPGDILLVYAFFGFFLVLFRNVSDRGLIKWAFWLLIIPSLISLLAWGMVALFSSIPEAAEAMDAGIRQSAESFEALSEKASLVYLSGTFSEIISMRWEEYIVLMTGGMIFFYPVVLAMFLVGAWIARKGFVKNFNEYLPFIRRVFFWSLPLGILLNSIYAYGYQVSDPYRPGFWSFITGFAHSVGGISFALLYTSGIILLTAKGSLKNFNEALAPVGRMALTNYLLHSIICTTLFYSYGFGLLGKVEVWQGIILTIVIFALQIPFSKWWLKRFRYVPFERLWRSLTYWKLQPFRITF